MNKIKSFVKGEAKHLKSELSVPEYASWWVLRIMMIAALAVKYIKAGDSFDMNVLTLALNLLATFTVPLVRLLLFPKKLVCKLPFRSQTYLNILIFFASFCGQGLNAGGEITSWDKIMHLLTGILFIFIGDEIMRMFEGPGDKISPYMRAFTAFGFSNAAIVIWEIFEFFVDYYWPGSSNQAYNISPERDPLFFKIFGMGAQNENQWAVFDTCVDMLCAFVTSAIGGALLLLILYRREKKQIAVSLDKEALSV